MPVAICALLLTPVAAALTVISVHSQSISENLYAGPVFSDTYTWSLSPTVFDQPIYRANTALSWDFGTVQANTVVHAQTNWTISGVGVGIRSYGEKVWTGEHLTQTSVQVNGTQAWQIGFTAGLFGNFNYQETHHIRYSENITAAVPKDSAGDPTFNWANAANPTDSGNSILVENLTGLFWVHGDASSEAFRSDNQTGATSTVGVTSGPVTRSTHYWLANTTHPTAWSVATSYQDRAPNQLIITTLFQEEATFLAAADAEVDNCGGIARIFEDIVGICPTLEGTARWAIGLVPNILAFFLDFINPSAGNALRMVGDTAAEFVASYIFILTIIASSPGNLFIVITATLSGAAFMAGGIKGDIQSILEMHRTLFKGLFIAAFWYFYIYWLLIRWIVDRIIQMLSAIGQYIPFT